MQCAGELLADRAIDRLLQGVARRQGPQSDRQNVGKCRPLITPTLVDVEAKLPTRQ